MSSRSHFRHPSLPRRRRVVVAVTTATVLAFGALVGAPAQAADPVLIDLVTINDFHGRIEASSPSGGIAALATAVNDIRARNANTVFAAAGDLIGASTFVSFIQQDQPTIDAFNAAGLDVSSVGNHEFDRGWDDLRGRVMSSANWSYLGANVYDRATNKPALPEYYTETFDGVTIGFIGAVTNELPSLVSPAGIAALEVKDVTTEVNRVAADLRDGDPPTARRMSWCCWCTKAPRRRRRPRPPIPRAPSGRSCGVWMPMSTPLSPGTRTSLTTW